MFYRRKLILALLEAFRGKTDRLMFQKLLFILNTRLDSPVYHFLPYKYGCFSFQANSDLLTLEKQGFVTADKQNISANENESWLFTLDDRDKLKVKKLADDFKDFTTDDLINYTYKNYPFYAIRSTIIDKHLDDDGIKKVEAAKSKETSPALFTLGYEGLSIEQYINVLLKHNIQLLVDVRKNAMSMKYGFSKKTLQTACETVGIIYEHYPELGIVSDKRKNLETQADYDTLFAEYRNTVLKETVPVQITLCKKIETMKRAALLCFEKKPEMCHRSHLANVLVHHFSSNFPLIHLHG